MNKESIDLLLYEHVHDKSKLLNNEQYINYLLSLETKKYGEIVDISASNIIFQFNY